MHNLQSSDALGSLILATNVLLILVAPFIIKLIYHEDSGSSGFLRKVRILRALNLLIIISVLIYIFGIHLADQVRKLFNDAFTKIGDADIAIETQHQRLSRI